MSNTPEREGHDEINMDSNFLLKYIAHTIAKRVNLELIRSINHEEYFQVQLTIDYEGFKIPNYRGSQSIFFQ